MYLKKEKHWKNEGLKDQQLNRKMWKNMNRQFTMILKLSLNREVQNKTSPVILVKIKYVTLCWQGGRGNMHSIDRKAKKGQDQGRGKPRDVDLGIICA